MEVSETKQHKKVRNSEGHILTLLTFHLSNQIDTAKPDVSGVAGNVYFELYVII